MAKKTSDILIEHPGLIIIHQKIASREVGEHEHEEHEFFLPLQGDIAVQWNAKAKEAKAGPGRMLYVPPNLHHSFTSTSQGSGERVIWLINPKLWQKQAGAKKFDPTSLPLNTLAKELIFYLLIHPKSEGSKYFTSALIETLKESLLAENLQARGLASEHLEGKIRDERIKKSVQHIDDNLSQTSLAKIAEVSGLSPRNFNRLFLQELGMTPKDYVLQRRIELAKRLLKETKMTVTDISLEVGYNSFSKFISTFKRLSGSLPSDYRNAQK